MNTATCASCGATVNWPDKTCPHCGSPIKAFSKLTACRICAGPVAFNASKCPHCGARTPNKQNFIANILVSIILVVLLSAALVLVVGSSLDFDANIVVATSPTTSPAPQKESTSIPTFHLVSPGSVIDRGGYILFEDLHIYYDGEAFSIKNNREDSVIVTVMVVGVKADGSYELLQCPAFGGVDEAQYQKDLDENGWAVENYTNRVRPGETLRATLQVFDFSTADESYPPPDVDGDGYYDIIFCVHPQGDGDSITVSTADPESDIYKLKAD